MSMARSAEDRMHDSTREQLPGGHRSHSDVVPSLNPRPRAVTPVPHARIVRRPLGTLRGSVIARRYRITETIGVGGAGTVYEALDLRTGNTVALKMLTCLGDEVGLRRLRREAESAMAVRSDRVCRVHYLGVAEGSPFIVMERLRGETLRRRLTDVGALPFRVALEVADQLLEALSATHAAGIIHRDVKPANIFVTSERGKPVAIKLIDFGLVKPLGTSDDPSPFASTELRITAPGGMPGTLHYLAPEQLLGHADIDQRLDVWAAGLVLFEMLTGRRAFVQAPIHEVVRRILFDPPPRARASRDRLPEGVDHVLAMALAKDRRRRFWTAAAFRRALSTLA
jgi:serine/threonine-protein kinase